jgi:hypothetical protein
LVFRGWVWAKGGREVGGGKYCGDNQRVDKKVAKKLCQFKK